MKGRSGDRRASPRVILHFGPHKTATTAFQLMLRARSDALAQGGIVAFSRHSRFDAYEAYWRESSRLRVALALDKPTDGAILTGEAERLVSAARAEGADVLVLSDENAPGFAPGTMLRRHQRFVDGFYPTARRVVELHRAAFEAQGCTVEVAWVTRPFPSLLRSLYLNAMADLRSADDWDEFVDRIDLASFAFQRLVDDTLAAGAPVRTVPLRDFALAPHRIIGADAPPLPPLAHSNAGLIELQHDVARLLNAHVRADEIDSLRTWLNAMPALEGGRKPALPLPPSVAERIDRVELREARFHAGPTWSEPGPARPSACLDPHERTRPVRAIQHQGLPCRLPASFLTPPAPLSPAPAFGPQMR